MLNNNRSSTAIRCSRGSTCTDQHQHHHPNQDYQDRYHLYHHRYYVLVFLTSVLACGFHQHIFHRYHRMEDTLQEASHLKFEMQMDELHALELHAEAADLYRHSINHTLQAIELAHDATTLKYTILNQTHDMTQLQAEMIEDEQDADRDSQEASLWAIRSYGDNLASMGSSTTAHQLATLAAQEHDMAIEHMNHSTTQHEMGVQHLREAQEQVRIAQQHDDVAANADSMYGICRIFKFACTATTSSSASSGSSQQRPQQPSQESIRANLAVQNAWKEINQAQVERDVALELFQNSSVHANTSTQLLHDAAIFHDEAQYDQAQSIAYRDEAREEATEASMDKELIQEDQTKIQNERNQLNRCVNESRTVLYLAITEHRRASVTATAMEHQWIQVRTMETLVDTKTNEAYQHIAKAGWYALVSIVAASCLFVVVVVRVIGTFRYSRPFQWIIRTTTTTTHHPSSSSSSSSPYLASDILYLINHIFIMILAMGFVGEVLYHFGEETVISKIFITILFAIVAAFFQVTFLHFVPHTFRLCDRPSDFATGNVQILLYEDIVKKGIIVFFVCGIEMLLVWVNVGSYIFHQAYKLDSTWWIWIVVGALSISYSLFLRKNEHLYNNNNPYSAVDTSGYLDVFDHAPSGTASNNNSGDDADVERAALLATSNESSSVSSSINQGSMLGGSVSGSVQQLHSSSSIHPGGGSQIGSYHPIGSSQPSSQPSPGSSETMKSVPLGSHENDNDASSTAAAGVGYGSVVLTASSSSTIDRYNYLSSTHPEIHSTFITSWRNEFEKLELLLEMLLLSWAVWVFRNSIMLIIKLSPLANDVAWGRLPLWILNIFLLVVLVCFGLWCTTNQHKK